MPVSSKSFFVGLIMLTCLVFSCTSTENNQQIVGEWSGVEWLVNNKPSGYDALNTSFSFDEKGNYQFNYISNVEKGTYKVENDMLFTRPEGEREIMVKIVQLTPDTLVFDMNRGGKPEKLTLIRKK